VNGVAEGETDPLVEFRRELRDLFNRVRRPTYRRLEFHANHDGRTLRTSTVSDLLNGPAVPRWDTVESFVRACTGYARAHDIAVPSDLLSLQWWHARYRAMENGLADRDVQREQATARRERGGRRLPPTPAQLPANPPAFTGRAQQLSELDKLLRAGSDTVVISAIDGTAGVGKTALALQWAHQVADQFPDGQLYVNLRGFDASGQVMEPATAVRGFLDALEVPSQRTSADPDAQVALYRSLLSGRRMLIMLDNARDSGQVRPLLPGTPGCLVVVTSRNQLSSLLATHGARPVTLDLLAPDEARDLLATRLGAERLDAEPDAVARIIARCARLPLALTLVAAHAALRPQLRLHILAEQLDDTQRRWDVLTGDDPATDLRAVLSWSYRAVSPAARRLFRLLGVHPGPDIGAPAAASLAARTPAESQALITELARANLVTESAPGRYTLHDLLRSYATELVEATDPDRDRRAATHRLLDHYVHSSCHADGALNPGRDPIRLAPPEAGVTAERPADHVDALAWFADERAVLLTAAHHALAAGFDAHAWQLAWAMRTFLDRSGHWHDQMAIAKVALAGAERSGDRVAQAHADGSLALAYLQLRRYDDARFHLNRALDTQAENGDQRAQAHTHLFLARVWDATRSPAEAQQHSRLAYGLFQAVGDRRGQALALNSIGWCDAQLGDHDRALELCERALTLHQQVDNQVGAAATWDSLGHAHSHLGHHSEALTCYRNACGLFRDLGFRYEEATTLANLGDAYRDAGQAPAARAAYQQALTILEELDHSGADVVRDKLATFDT
jgi:tetratricopeptide (TPR) repeat protein